MKEHRSPFQEEGSKIIKAVGWEGDLGEELDVCLPEETMALCVMAHVCGHSYLRG